MPPFLEYIAKVTLCTAGENPAPIALNIPNTVKESGVGARPINVYEMISTTRDARTSPRSNAGEWISFFVGKAVGLRVLEAPLPPELTDSSG